jgi:hypothetical protein
MQTALLATEFFGISAGVGLLHQYWDWLLGATLVLGIGIELLLRRSSNYSATVAKELEEFINPPQVAQTPLEPTPPSNPDTAAVAEHKQSIWQGIRAHPAPSNEVQIGWLVERLAKAQVDVRFRKMYFSMLGSQHRFLRELNQNTGAISRANSETFLRQLGEQDQRIRAYVFTEWIGAMVNAGLLSTGVESFALTPIGRDFLVWVTREGFQDRTVEV